MEISGVMFYGEHEHILDSKGRLTIPLKLRAPLKDFCIDQFVVVRGFETCLYMFAPSEWHVIDKNFRSFKHFTKKKSRLLQRKFFAGASPVDCDKQGRILIPKYLLKYAGIEKNVVLVGASSRIEVWSKDNLKEEMASVENADYSELVEGLMDFE